MGNAIGGGGGAPSGVAGGDLGSTYPNPTVVQTHLASALPVAQGGTAATSASAALTSLGAMPASAIISGQYLCPPTQYAPGTQQVITTTSATLAAVSSTNISTGSFTAPASGDVLVTASFVATINSPSNDFAFGLLSHGGSTVFGSVPVWGDGTTGIRRPYALQFLVTGLTPGNTFDFDLAFAVAGASTLSVYAFSQSTTSPGLGSGFNGAPVVMTVQAI